MQPADEVQHTLVDRLIPVVTATERIDFRRGVKTNLGSDGVPELFCRLSAEKSVLPDVATEHDGVERSRWQSQVLLVATK